MKRREQGSHIPDFRNLEVLKEVLEGGDDHLFQELVVFAGREGISQERVERWRDVARIRKEVIERTHQELIARVQGGSPPTGEELAMGIFWEQIEPQVRDACKTLFAKGYRTRFSGFDELEWQSIGLFSEVQPPLTDDQIQALRAQGVVVEVHRDEGMDTLLMQIDDMADMDAVREAWKKVVDIVPDVDSKKAPAYQDEESFWQGQSYEVRQAAGLIS